MLLLRRAHKRPSTPPETIVRTMGGLWSWLNLGDDARGYRAMRAFSRAAGARIQKVARAEKLRGATLYIRVVSSAWSHELHALKGELLEKLRRTPGGEGVEELRFSVGPLDEAPDWNAPAPPEPKRPRRPAPPPPPVEEMRRVAEGVADPELREALSRLCDCLSRP